IGAPELMEARHRIYRDRRKRLVELMGDRRTHFAKRRDAVGMNRLLPVGRSFVRCPRFDRGGQRSQGQGRCETLAVRSIHVPWLPCYIKTQRPSSGSLDVALLILTALTAICRELDPDACAETDLMLPPFRCKPRPAGSASPSLQVARASRRDLLRPRQLGH